MRKIFEPIAKSRGFRSESNLKEYKKENPELFEAMGGSRYIPINALIHII